MMFERLRVENLLGCSYEIEFDTRYTVVIGDNRKGKTLTARLIMLALFGTGTREKELHDSWKLRREELLSVSDKGSVELVIGNENKRYRITREFGKKDKVELHTEKEGSWGDPVARRDADVKGLLEEEVGITPGLMNVIMSNEQSLIGAISYDDKLQASVWEGWKWRTEIIRENIRLARDRCGKAVVKLMEEIEGHEKIVDAIRDKWIEKEIFSEADADKVLSKERLEERLRSIDSEIGSIGARIQHYSEFHNCLIGLDNLDDKSSIDGIVRLCLEKKDSLDIDELNIVDELRKSCEGYSLVVEEVLKKGGKDGVLGAIRNLEDEEKKLKDARGLARRRKQPLRVECDIFSPEDGEKMVVQIPENVASSFKYEQIASGGIAVPYDEARLQKVTGDKDKMQQLLEDFERSKDYLRQSVRGVRDKTGDKERILKEHREALMGQKTILEADKDRYLEALKSMEEKEAVSKRLNVAKEWFGKLYESLSEEESLRKIKKETVAFINRIYEKIYEWDINAKLLEDGNKVVITDAQGNVRSHPSGSETHVMGLAWRWMVARSFDLPLVLDELDSLLDEKNFERTRRLIEEEMDRQTVILTLKEGLVDLPGTVYRITREEGLSTVVLVKQ